MGRELVRALRYVRTLLVMGLLVAALTLLNFFLGCGGEEKPVPLYGPPPDSEFDDDARYLYGPAPAPETLDEAGPLPDGVVPDGPGIDAVEYGPPDAVPDGEPADQPRVHYGPPPVDAVDSEPQDVQEDQPMILYGPPPVDVADTAPQDVDKDQAQTWYGPAPVDVQEDEVSKDVLDKEFATKYGPQPLYGVPESPRK